jgi:signal transduction histidine kinase
MVNTEGTRSLGTALAVAVLASAGLMGIYYYGGVAGHADSTPLRAAIVGTAVAAIAAALVWRFARGVYGGEAVDRLARRTALLGVIAAVSLAGFWIGITVPVCVAAVAVGLKAVAAGRPVRGYVTVGVAGTALRNTGTFFLAYVLAIYAAGRHLTGRALLAAGLVLVVAFPLAAIEPGQSFSVSDAAFIAVAFVGPFVAGLVIRRRLESESVLHGRALELERERDVKAREAVALERVRIARELHDVVAHAISVIVLQARGGRRMLPEPATETRAALDAIESAGEQALTEMRRLVGMLRHDDDELALAPQPSLSRIDDLVRSLRAAGCQSSCESRVSPPSCPQAPTSRRSGSSKVRSPTRSSTTGRRARS